MPTRSSSQGGSLRSEMSLSNYGEKGGNSNLNPATAFGNLSDRIPQRANVISKAEYDSMPNDYKTTVGGDKFIMVMDAKGGTSLAPWIERDARIPKGKSAWDIGRDEARGYGMDDEALQKAQKMELGGSRGASLVTINSSRGDPELGGFKANYPDAYRQAYDSYLIDSQRNPKSVRIAAGEALSGLSGKAVERMSTFEIQQAVDSYVQRKLGERFKGNVRWNIKSYPD